MSHRSSILATALLLLLGQAPLCLSIARAHLAMEKLGDATVPSRPPRLFFLFMAENDMPNLAIWKHFFAGAKPGLDFEAYLHCQDRQQCLSMNPDLNRTFHVIDTVESQWCEDLVTPMNALLTAALGNSGGSLADSGHEHDKFIFLSDTTVPLKSFRFVQHKLTVQDEHRSNFCVQEWPKWAWYKADQVLAKHSQWLVLNRAHAMKALVVAENVTPKKLMTQMTPLSWLFSEHFAPSLWRIRKHVVDFTDSQMLESLFSLVVPSVRGCTDEFWHLAASVGTLERHKAEHGIYFDDLSGKPLRMDVETAEDLQGECDTFAVIDGDSRELYRGLQGNGTSLEGTWGFLRPHIHAGKFTRLTGASLSALGSSKYLFARKMDTTTHFVDEDGQDGDMTLLEAFDRIIFAEL